MKIRDELLVAVVVAVGLAAADWYYGRQDEPEQLTIRWTDHGVEVHNASLVPTEDGLHETAVSLRPIHPDVVFMRPAEWEIWKGLDEKPTDLRRWRDRVRFWLELAEDQK